VTDVTGAPEVVDFEPEVVDVEDVVGFIVVLELLAVCAHPPVTDWDGVRTFSDGDQFSAAVGSLSEMEVAVVLVVHHVCGSQEAVPEHRLL
jgi:hypothetical protein